MDKINKDLILREKLALQRTILANQTTFLAFLRTSLYFLVAGLTINNIFELKHYSYIEVVFYAISLFLFIFGLSNYLIHRKRIQKAEIHVGNYKIDYEQTI